MSADNSQRAARPGFGRIPAPDPSPVQPGRIVDQPFEQMFQLHEMLCAVLIGVDAFAGIAYHGTSGTSADHGKEGIGPGREFGQPAGLVAAVDERLVAYQRQGSKCRRFGVATMATWVPLSRESSLAAISAWSG